MCLYIWEVLCIRMPPTTDIHISIHIHSYTYVYEGRQTKRICISIQCSDSSTSSLMISSATYYLFIRHHHHPQSNHLSPATTVLPRRFVLDELIANANICMRWMDAGQVESDRISRNVALLCIKRWLREKWSASELLLCYGNNVCIFIIFSKSF